MNQQNYGVPVRMLTINEAAQRVPGLTRYRIREMCIRGELPCIMAGRKYLICEQVLIQKLTGAVPLALSAQAPNCLTEA